MTVAKYIEELFEEKSAPQDGNDNDEKVDDVGKKLTITMSKAEAARYEKLRKNMKPLEGCFVALTGTGLRMNEPTGSASNESVDVDGKQGRCLAWVQEKKKFVVETFDGLSVFVAEDQCKKFEPAGPEEKGGFDVAWPHGSIAMTGFAANLGSALQEKNYCVIQMFGGEALAKDAKETASKRFTFKKLPADVEEDYLGYHTDSKTAWMPPSSLPKFRQKTLAKDKEQPGLVLQDYDHFSPNMCLGGLDALTRCDMCMTNIGALLWSVTPEFPGDDQAFAVWGRTNAMLRSSINGSAERAALRLKLDVPTEEETEAHAQFADKRRLCMFYFIDGDAGDFTLHTPDGDVQIPVTANKVVAFRHDLMGYTYRPKGDSLAMQAWLLDTPAALEELEEEMRVITGPPEPPGKRVNVMGAATRYPGLGQDYDQYWNMLVAGTDGQIQVPILRWDIDVYYRPEHTVGFSMTCHGAHMSQDDVELFDNDFFGIEVEEAKTMAPLQRIVLEVGYSCLYSAGHRREGMPGWNCGVFVGDSGSDWDMGQDNTSLNTGSRDALVVGINTMVGPGTYISLSGPGMLTHKGRCFTFDQSADGYARGEGCGSIKLKTCDDEYDSMGRLAMLVGSCVNQDGRSASMTAPHGPSQQDVIRNSMKEGGLDPRDITIAECHGTGTALGDPIEVGALRGVMKDKRSAPFLKTSTKTNLGHMEAAAGMGGFIKCLQMLNWCAGAPNNHLLTLNPHLDVAGYAVVFETEIMDFEKNSGLTGVSSFGFGGTNARADVWGNAIKGRRKCITGTVYKERKILV